LFYLRNDRTTTKVSTDYTRVPRLRSVTVLYGILSGSDWLRPTVKEDHVLGGHLHTARESQPGTLYIRFQLWRSDQRRVKSHQQVRARELMTAAAVAAAAAER